MENIDKTLSREELRVKMCELQNEAQRYRNAIDVIDKKSNEEKYLKLINKCFLRGDNEWIIVKTCDENYNLYGLIILDMGDNYIQLCANQRIWEDYIEESKEISIEEFNKKLQEVLKIFKKESDAIKSFFS